MTKYILSILALCIILSTSVHAQQNTTKPAGTKKQVADSLRVNIGMEKQLDEIVVSASRGTETRDKVPSTISIVGKKQIESQMAISPNIAEILAKVPGMAVASNRTSNFGQTLRGRGLLIMIDGIPQSTPLRNGGMDVRTIDPGVLERVEIIKGATAIYGNGADGGLINYITKQPGTDKPFAATTNLSTGGSLTDLNKSIGGRISQQFFGKLNKFSYVAGGMYDKTGVYRDADGNILPPRYGLGQNEAYNAFAKLGYEINENNSVDVMYNYFSNRQKTDYVVKPGIPGSEPASAEPGVAPGIPEGTPYNHNAQVHYTSKALPLNTNLDVNLYMQNFYTIYFWSPTFKNGGQSTIKSNKKGVRINFNTPYMISNAVNGSVTYGIDFLNDITSQYLTDGRVWAPEMNMKNYAPYAQLKATLFRDFVFKGGLRYENINVDVPDYTTLVTINQTTGKESGGIAVHGGNLDYDALVFNAGLRYTKFENFNPYFSYSQGFTINELGRILRTAQANYLQTLKPEAIVVNNYELGFNSRFNKLTFSAAGYLSTSRLGANTKELNGVYYVLRAPEKVYGFEVVADYRFNEKLQAGVSYDYIEGKVDENNDDTYEKYLPGNRIMPQKFTSYIEYSPLRSLGMRMQWLYTADRKRFEKNAAGTYGYAESPVSSTNVLNFNTYYSINKKMKVSLGIENLLNNDYYTINSQWENDAYLYQKGNGTRATISLSVNW